jgi:hypothetical protein
VTSTHTPPSPVQQRSVPVEWDARVVRWLGLVVVALAAVVLASWALIAVAHINDTYAINHVSGAWLALARYVNEGVLYPPLYNGSSFGGTRFMPLEFVMHAGVARITGEYLVSGKLLAYLSGVGLYALVFFVVRSLSRSTALALGLVAAVVVTQTGLQAVTGVRGDALPAALQLAAVAWVARGARGSAAGAGVLCAIAFACKLSTLWAPVAIVLWLAFRDRRQLLFFLLSFAVVGGALLAIFQLASDGRMSENILHLGTSGVHQVSAWDTPTRFISLFRSDGDAVWIVFPFALAGLVFALVRRRLTIFHISFVAAALLLLAVLTDVGAFSNHFLDIEVLTVVLVAEAWGATATLEGHQLLRALALTALIWGIATSYQLVERVDTSGAARTLLGRGVDYGPTPLRGVIKPGDKVLSEDPYVAVSRGQNPVVLDPFMVLRLGRDHPQWRAALVKRLDARRFTKVVLMRRLDPTDPWWRVQHFGPEIAAAMARNYRLSATAPRYYHPTEPDLKYWIYVPRS